MKPRRPRKILSRCGHCGGKITFKSRGDGERFLRYNDGPDPDFGTNMNVYRCPHAPGWHVGHTPYYLRWGTS